MATTALTPAATTYRTGLYEWLTTTDHKKIGIMYVINSFLFFFIGGLLALGVRVELAQPGAAYGFGQRAAHLRRRKRHRQILEFFVVAGQDDEGQVFERRVSEARRPGFGEGFSELDLALAAPAAAPAAEGEPSTCRRSSAARC